jgi:hypothetical protein
MMTGMPVGHMTSAGRVLGVSGEGILPLTAARWVSQERQRHGRLCRLRHVAFHWAGGGLTDAPAGASYSWRCRLEHWNARRVPAWVADAEDKLSLVLMTTEALPQSVLPAPRLTDC